MRQPQPLRTYADDKWLVVDHEDLRGVSFARARLMSFAAIGSRFERCVFAGVSIDDAELAGGAEPSEYADCVFDRARIGRVRTGVARFVRCSFRQVRFRAWQWGAVDLIDCTFSGSLGSAVISGTVPDAYRAAAGRARNTILGNDFRGLRMTEVQLVSGVDLTLQRMPQDADHLLLRDARSALRLAERELPRCPEPWRAGVRRRLRRIGALVDGGQRQAWLSRRAFFHGQPDAARWLVDLWTRDGQLSERPDG